MIIALWCFGFAYASDRPSKHPKGHSVPPVTHGPSVRNAFAQDVTKKCLEIGETLKKCLEKGENVTK